MYKDMKYFLSAIAEHAFSTRVLTNYSKNTLCIVHACTYQLCRGLYRMCACIVNYIHNLHIMFIYVRR